MILRRIGGGLGGGFRGGSEDDQEEDYEEESRSSRGGVAEKEGHLWIDREKRVMVIWVYFLQRE